jgi:hypothetical protein
MSNFTLSIERSEGMSQKGVAPEEDKSSEIQSLANKGPIEDVLDFSFIEVLAVERRVVETGGSCASCS